MKDYKFYTKISIIFITIYIVLGVSVLHVLLKNYSLSVITDSLSQLVYNTNVIKRVYSKIHSVDKTFEEELLIQNIIEDSHKQNNFISIINWSGNYVCYPEIFKVGEKPSSNNIFEEEKVDAAKVYNKFFSLFSSLKSLDTNIPIIALDTINDSDLIIANHINLEEIDFKINHKKSFYAIVISILGILLWVFILWVCRFLSIYFSKQIDLKVDEIIANSKSIEDLNASLEKYQESLTKIQPVEPPTLETNISDTTNEETTKERILTYVRNELVPITISSIAYIYVENTITYIVTKEGRKSTTPDSLDKIYGLLDDKIYFKVNRQFIVGISAIEKITKFENSKLKLEVNPVSELDIVIGKNKVSQFKQWLDL